MDFGASVVKDELWALFQPGLHPAPIHRNQLQELKPKVAAVFRMNRSRGRRDVTKGWLFCGSARHPRLGLHSHSRCCCSAPCLPPARGKEEAVRRQKRLNGKTTLSQNPQQPFASTPWLEWCHMGPAAEGGTGLGSERPSGPVSEEAGYALGRELAVSVPVQLTG